jgi:hypothetical protein
VYIPVEVDPEVSELVVELSVEVAFSVVDVPVVGPEEASSVVDVDKVDNVAEDPEVIELVIELSVEVAPSVDMSPVVPSMVDVDKAVTVVPKVGNPVVVLCVVAVE